MYTTIPTAALSREEWLRLRKTGIGGSDAGAVCGLNPYSSAMSVYLDKTTDAISEEDSESTRIGRDLEDYVARRFMEATGLKVRRSNRVYRSVEHPFMLADVDRLIVGEDAGLECKTANAFNAGKWEGGLIPPHYIAQCCHYMAVTGKGAWYIAALILGVGFQYVRLTRDEESIRDLVAMEERFWNRHVVPRAMPEPDGSEACSAALGRLFPEGNQRSVPLVGFDGRLERREEILRAMEELDTERKKIEQEVKLFMGENERAVSGHYRVSWASVETSRLDTKRMKAEAPELYREFLKTSTSRRFEIKAARGQAEAA